ncbi:hypothetical protein CRUP_013158 [Coryphaenoides rupestris]|nr:hypothetical protein CRUP_013158 [Coryphaenoides rupestris]
MCSPTCYLSSIAALRPRGLQTHEADLQLPLVGLGVREDPPVPGPAVVGWPVGRPDHSAVRPVRPAAVEPVEVGCRTPVLPPPAPVARRTALLVAVEAAEHPSTVGRQAIPRVPFVSKHQ